MERRIEISHSTIIFTVILLLGLWFVYYIRDIILEFYVSLIIMSCLNPLVVRLTRYKISRILSVSLAYIIVFGILGGAIYSLIPILVEQTTGFVNNLPKFLDSLGIPVVFGQQVMTQFLSQLGALPGQFAKAAITLFSNVFNVISVLIFSFYLLLEGDSLLVQIRNVVGERQGDRVKRFVALLETKLGGWARAELTLMFLVGFLNFLGLTLLSVPYALPLAILAGIFEIIPIIGPFISAIPAVIVGFGVSPITGVATASLAFLVQQVEAYVFVPKVMEKTVGVNPVITLLALSVGFRLAGIFGILISVPVVITIRIILQEYFASEHQLAKS